ncbi:hypothetical protein [Flavobacterium chilense]|uniref:Uncharacterized protein n=1 Tax=Flavobacterium chilense TaxID=946677 RepID=A0A1M6ZXY8_9FLAO|nr:hypothetical protein [Flavobacterium chilense]SHL35352.1 hypothetical protein SAMN05444484_1011198 [Flavobacterium chilense]
MFEFAFKYATKVNAVCITSNKLFNNFFNQSPTGHPNQNTKDIKRQPLPVVSQSL